MNERISLSMDQFIQMLEMEFIAKATSNEQLEEIRKVVHGNALKTMRLTSKDRKYEIICDTNRHASVLNLDNKNIIIIQDNDENKNYMYCAYSFKDFIAAVEVLIHTYQNRLSGNSGEKSTNAKFCPNCGAETGGSKFCPSCGSSTAIGGQSQPVYAPGSSRQTNSNKDAKKKFWILTLGAAAIVVFIGINSANSRNAGNTNAANPSVPENQTVDTSNVDKSNAVGSEQKVEQSTPTIKEFHRYTYHELAQDLKNNRLRANENHAGEYVTVEGIFSEIYDDGFDINEFHENFYDPRDGLSVMDYTDYPALVFCYTEGKDSIIKQITELNIGECIAVSGEIINIGDFYTVDVESIKVVSNYTPPETYWTSETNNTETSVDETPATVEPTTIVEEPIHNGENDNDRICGSYSAITEDGNEAYANIWKENGVYYVWFSVGDIYYIENEVMKWDSSSKMGDIDVGGAGVAYWGITVEDSNYSTITIGSRFLFQTLYRE